MIFFFVFLFYPAAAAASKTKTKQQKQKTKKQKNKKTKISTVHCPLSTNKKKKKKLQKYKNKSNFNFSFFFFFFLSSLHSSSKDFLSYSSLENSISIIASIAIDSTSLTNPFHSSRPPYFHSPILFQPSPIFTTSSVPSPDLNLFIGLQLWPLPPLPENISRVRVLL